MPRHKASSKGVTKKQVYKIAREVKASNPQAQKDLVSAGDDMHDAGTITQLSQVAQGTDYNSRTGNTILLKRFSINMSASQVSANLASFLCRVIIFRWGGDDTPTLASIISDTGTGSTNINSHFRTTMEGGHIEKYSILYDKQFTLPVGGGANDKLTWRHFTFNKSYKKGTNIKYSDTGATDYDDGNIFLLCLSDHPNASSNPPLLKYHFRMWFQP